MWKNAQKLAFLPKTGWSEISDHTRDLHFAGGVLAESDSIRENGEARDSCFETATGSEIRSMWPQRCHVLRSDVQTFSFSPTLPQIVSSSRLHLSVLFYIRMRQSRGPWSEDEHIALLDFLWSNWHDGEMGHAGKRLKFPDVDIWERAVERLPVKAGVTRSPLACYTKWLSVGIFAFAACCCHLKAQVG